MAPAAPSLHRRAALRGLINFKIFNLTMAYANRRDISTAAPSDWMEEGLQQCLPTITHVNCFGLIHSRPGACPAEIY